MTESWFYFYRRKDGSYARVGVEADGRRALQLRTAEGTVLTQRVPASLAASWIADMARAWGVRVVAEGPDGQAVEPGKARY